MNARESFPRWEFARKLPNAVQSEPISDEFFSGLSAAADKLVRESIQNSLDASTGKGPVRVKFTISADVQVTRESSWLAGLGPHLMAERNGLAQRYNPSEPLSVLLIEDYGTSGLTGDPTQTDNVSEEWRNKRNHFFYFWRAIGATGKGDGEKGSWGLGKSVLPASSQIHTFFGVSCEAAGDNARLLGLSVLKTHTVAGRSDTLTPYGYFGVYESADCAAMPLTDAAAVTAFCNDFGVTRQGEPGLSLVVLYPRLGFTGPALTAAVVVNYFFPILEGQLIVEVTVGGKTTIIDAASIAECAPAIPPSLLDDHDIEPVSLIDLLELARWSIANRRDAALRLNPPPKPPQPRWEDSVFSVNGWAEAVSQFSAGQAVEFVVPVCVTPLSGPPLSAAFFVSMKKVDSSQKAKSFYLRDGITIGGIKGPPVARGLVAFTAVESDALAKFLRLSEDPSHSEWREKGTRLGEQYEKPQLLMRYVKNGIGTIYDRLTRVGEGIDSDLLADLFFLDEDAPDSEPRPTAGGRGIRAQRPRVPKNLVAEAQPIRVAVRADGILLAGLPDVARAGQVIRARIAYDVRRGNPFQKWSPNDFDLADLKNSVEWDGALGISAEGCMLEFVVERPDFQVLISGLDASRDVLIETTVVPNS